MRHLNIWLDKYGQRRAQILKNWADISKNIGETKAKIPPKDIFDKLENTEKTDQTMCFVDGGEGIRELLGLGIYMIRASALILNPTETNRQKETFIRDLDMNIIDYDEHTKERVELLRDGMEYDTAIRCVKEHTPKIMFLDGSLYVKAYKKPTPTSEYEHYRKKYSRLLKTCKNGNTRLIGISEDSKSRLLISHLTHKHGVKIPKIMTDSTILKLLSTEGSYRTINFTPKDKPAYENTSDENIINGFQTAYIQPNSMSNPLRIDAPSWESDFGGILALIAALCKGSGHYGYPLPLYIAHLDAHIPINLMDWTTKQIVSYLSKKDPQLADTLLKNTRRQDRPQK